MGRASAGDASASVDGVRAWSCDKVGEECCFYLLIQNRKCHTINGT